MPYSFRLPLTLSSDCSLFFEDPTLGSLPRTLTLGDHQIVVEPEGVVTATGASQLVAKGDGFPTVESALSTGRATRSVLLAAADRIRIGLQSTPGEDFLMASVAPTPGGRVVLQPRGAPSRF